jgi:hypothetical protein
VASRRPASTYQDQFVPYINLSTSFETPTTTELRNRPGASGGFNEGLKPQRAVNYEIGARRAGALLEVGSPQHPWARVLRRRRSNNQLLGRGR